MILDEAKKKKKGFVVSFIIVQSPSSNIETEAFETHGRGEEATPTNLESNWESNLFCLVIIVQSLTYMRHWSFIDTRQK